MNGQDKVYDNICVLFEFYKWPLVVFTFSVQPGELETVGEEPDGSLVTNGLRLPNDEGEGEGDGDGEEKLSLDISFIVTFGSDTLRGIDIVFSVGE